MKAIVLGGAAASLLTVSAFAADLGIPQAAPGPVIPAFTWTGCYGGLQAGGGWGEKDLTDTAQALSPTSGFTSANLNISGYVIGGQIGCDYQFAPNWVVGIEGSVAGGNIGASTAPALTVAGAIPGDNATFKETTDLLASATGRIGYAWNNWMLYGKGGVAWSNDRYDAPGVFTGVPYELQGSETRIGWTVGAGVEWAFSDVWSVKVEYDYYGFGNRNVTFVEQTGLGVVGPENIKQTIQVVKIGVNFHARSGPDW
jgi:outer membrane immunogenic protein